MAVTSLNLQPDTPRSSLLTQPRSLVEHAHNALTVAAQQHADNAHFFQEERNVWRPDSWLLQRCWEELAEIGAVEETLEVAALAEARKPLSLSHALHRVAQRVGDHPVMGGHILSVLEEMEVSQWHEAERSAPDPARDRLLWAAATAATCGASSLAFAFLERLDQSIRPWDAVVIHPEKRELLTEVLAHTEPHPLAVALLIGANRRFGEAGDNLVHKVALAVDSTTRPGMRLLDLCADSMRFAALTTMHSQRLAVAVMARAGEADAVLRQLETIATVQEARRESGLALRRNDQQLLRQVKRPQANADVDFLVYTLQEAIRVMPLREIEREQRVALARQLATLGRQSDGWTAAGAAATLVDLGALKLAIEVVDHIAPTDPTRSEGAIALVDRLLAVREDALAREQVQKALTWAQTQEGKNAERATVWGLAEVYLKHGYPDRALALLDTRTVQPGFWTRLRSRFRSVMTDDQLRDDRVRLRAKLQLGDMGRETDLLLHALRNWGPRLLEGESLVNYYLDGLLAPLLETARWADVWSLLPEVQSVLARVSGERHTVHVRHAADLLIAHMDVMPPDEQPPAKLTDFFQGLWSQDAQRGIWQVVHGIEGALPSILALEGPEAVIRIAQMAATEGDTWNTAGPVLDAGAGTTGPGA